MHTSPGGDPALDVRTVRRQLAALLPESRPTGEGEGTLELASSLVDAPRLISATVLEGSGPLRARRVFDAPIAGFRGFLDGTQRSVVAVHLHGVPMVCGIASAVVRERRNRRMHTWRMPLVEMRVYAPREALSKPEWDALSTMYRDRLVDTTDGEADTGSHPLALRDAAYHRVQAHREALEQRLAEQWCTTEKDRLFIDGGISGSETVAASSCTVGVVKSHRTLYAEGPALQTILGLGRGELVPSAARSRGEGSHVGARARGDRAPRFRRAPRHRRARRRGLALDPRRGLPSRVARCAVG